MPAGTAPMIARSTVSLIAPREIPVPAVRLPGRTRLERSPTSGAVHPSRVALFLVILPDATSLNDPQLAFNHRIRKPDGKGANRVAEVVGREPER